VRTEQRTIVPFKGASAAESLLDSITFEMSIAGSAPKAAEEVERVHPAHLATLSLTARFGFADELIDRLAVESGIARSNMLLVFVATGNVARRSSILAKWELHNDLSKIGTHAIRPSEVGNAALSDAAGFSVTALVRLRSGLERKPLRAHVAGTVLGRRTVTFRLPQDNPGLSPIPLTKERRDELGLPEDCMTFVNCDSLLESDSLTDRVSVYIDETILSELTVDTPATRQLQAGLSIDIVIAMASQIHRELEEAGTTRGEYAETVQQTYASCSAFLERTCKSMRLPVEAKYKEDILDWARNDPARLRAHLEHGWKVRDLTVRVMRGGEA
jgi:hypothetical protein